MLLATAASPPPPMFSTMLRGLKELLVQPCCQVCHQPVDQRHAQQDVCPRCWESIGLPTRPLQGLLPLPWIAAGHYEGRLRFLLLQLRRTRNLAMVRVLSRQIRDLLPAHAILVPIPSWKQSSRANPLPTLLTQALQRPSMPLLIRTSPCFPQHHLHRQQRWQNSRGTMGCSACVETAVNWGRHQAWIVDDILTTGATASEAAETLRRAHVPVAGAVCLARTPKRRSQQGSKRSTP